LSEGLMHCLTLLNKFLVFRLSAKDVILSVDVSLLNIVLLDC